ncbi:MAG: hypothetical protein EOP34_00655 [Rickettsiales bacterium]|nr:MAG: hypothetical protein EOP34_00655 [Rickettsiales bacterium]
MLRSIPNKLLGVIAMFSAILVLLVMPFADLGRNRGIQFRPLSKIAFYIFIANFLILMQLGAKHVESPFIEFGQISTLLYFSHFLIIVPLISLLENSLIELNSNKKEKADGFSLLLSLSNLYRSFSVIIFSLFISLYNTITSEKISSIAKTVFKMLGLIAFFVILILLSLVLFSEPCFAMDEATQEMLTRIAKKRDMCVYFQDQIVGIQRKIGELIQIRGTMDDNTWVQLFENEKKGLKETHTNLSMEKKILSTLENKLKSGDFSDLSSSSTLGKRSFTDN